jgi:hypothetical protein
VRLPEPVSKMDVLNRHGRARPNPYGVSGRLVAFAKLPTCSTVVALANGAVTPSRAGKPYGVIYSSEAPLTLIVSLSNASGAYVPRRSLTQVDDLAVEFGQILDARPAPDGPANS